MGALEYSSTVTTPVNKPPVVNLTTPVNNSTFTSPANISLTASASDPDGSISKVEYYNGAVKIGESLTAPYTLTWSNVAAGTYSLTAVATDNLNSKTTSAVETISVNSPTTSNTPPVVKITNPSNGLNITSGSSLKITANASAANGSVSKVEFYNGATKLGESSTAPYSYTWSNIPHGTYAISAVATDNLNLKTTSKSVALWVN
jgi:chitinase